MTTSEREVVAALERALIHRLGEPRYHLWFDGHAKFTWTHDLLQVGVPNLHFQEWLQKKFGADMQEVAKEVFDQPMRVRFLIDPQLFQAARREQEELTLSSKSPPKLPPPAKSPPESLPPTSKKVKQHTGHAFPPKRARHWHRLADFVVGACNRVSHASAISALEAPGQAVNPLVWHGPVGTGKTHLLEGLYAGLRKTQADWRICYVTAEDFTNRFVQAMRLGKLGSFRKHFRECDALLFDDLHFLASKRATQEEFLHTFDVLQREGKQLVITCDCHPRLADDLSPELIDRLVGGAIWGLVPPEEETRFQILKSKALQQPGLPIAEVVLRQLAQTLRGNVRELEGALNTLRHLSHVTGRPVDVGLAREALADLIRHSIRVVNLTDIDATICRVLQLSSGSLQSKARNWMVSHPRMLAMFLARKHTAAAFSEVAQFFGARTHSTAVAAEKKVRQWLSDDEWLTMGDRRVRVRELVELVERHLLK
ncbi:MAG TPA: DnaA/Hda family protein [Gemmataceae bacterium]|nr:DnaA/Hda family protein [Gemmataceae bacterium]